MPRPMMRRGGLTINPLLFLLVLALVAVFVWRCWLFYDLMSHAAAGRSAAYATGTKIGMVFACVLWPLVCCAIAGAIGAGAYFITGRSDAAANGAMGLVLLAAVGFFGYTTYGFATQQRPASSPAGGSLSSLNTQMQDQLNAMKAAQQKQLDQMRQRAGAPTQPPATPMVRPQTDESPAAARRPAQTTPNAPAPPSDAVAEQRAAAALAPLREDIKAKSDAFITAAAPMVQTLAKMPRATKAEVDRRASECAELKSQAAELEAYFRDLDARVEKALSAAALDLHAQVRAKIAFSQAVDGFGRANAAAVYKRLFDAALEEAQALQATAGKWRLDAAGQPVSSDAALQSRLRHLHQVTQTHLRGEPEARTTIAKP